MDGFRAKLPLHVRKHGLGDSGAQMQDARDLDQKRIVSAEPLPNNPAGAQTDKPSVDEGKVDGILRRVSL
jgi:hypothetical protein